MKRNPGVAVVPLVTWASLVPPLPALLVSLGDSNRASLIAALSHASWRGIAAFLYLGLVATTFAYASWGRLLHRYPAATVTAFAFVSPCTGALASALVFGEVFGPLRYTGMALILAGVAVVVLPARAGRAQLRTR